MQAYQVINSNFIHEKNYWQTRSILNLIEITLKVFHLKSQQIQG